MKQYNKSVAAWKKEFIEWTQKREGAIGAAEGLIDKFYKKYDAMFKVNIARHLSFLGLVISAMFGTIFVAQKRKDTI